MTRKFDIKEDVKISNNGGFFCQACICGRPLSQRSKDERYCLECYDILKGEYGTEVPKNKKEEKKVKKQEALDLVTKLGESYETRSNDGHYDVVEKTTGKKVTNMPLAKVKPNEFRGLPVVKGKTVTFMEAPVKEVTDTTEEQPGESLTLKKLALKLNIDPEEIYQLVRKNNSIGKSGTHKGSRYYFMPEDVEKVKQLLKK